ncbi:hypothetical protein VOLCADRAFT_103268 [Volvox carteri f. nagariensis]|uniref:Uncharacterized protein n=1 Tax=Volvox carteri f. nagariensis TaxID=3068 RepID=D8TKW4_VOLCA|nr:uncharacterized protein VOLCADRAFT_103268 [Volvox carteri f. nagariensis]EFJ51634.1 hypothetical protein VOLCADRAFT_103268 [Volvox carteri f. nagariensis]|eukprot:XP_002947044.1 hypothetical protein VOLCADRAFT_103268 [Volvox carteri f. nagariensis]
MKCIERSWSAKPRTNASIVFVLRGAIRGALSKQPQALRTSTTGAPLSLNDIIAFESELPSLIDQAAVPERRVDELIDRAARVLREVSSVLEDAEGEPPAQQQPQQPGPLSTATLPGTLRPPGGAILSTSDATADAGPGSGVGPASPLSRALFGGSVQVSEREATLTRQALQRTLESGSAGRFDAASPGRDAAAIGGGNSSAGDHRPLALFFAPIRRKLLQKPPRWPRSIATHGSGSAEQQLPAPQLQPAAPSRRPLAAWAPLAFAEVDLSMPTELLLKSEESEFAAAARSAVLPPLQSVVDLTSAVRPPTRGLDLDLSTAAAVAAQDEQQAAVSAAVAVSEEEVVQGGALGRRLQDGAGRLADGTRFEKLSGTDTGPDGYVKKWEVLRGVTGDGQVQWEECWWQVWGLGLGGKASNRYGLRELGAFKKGTAESGAAWVEEWKEVLYTHPTNLRLVIERTAHKWARDENLDEWEEKWGECFEEAGRVHKWADKWAKAGSNVWHERWGEDYDGKGACQKWTDKWAERLLPDGGQEQWGDKWTETFGHGTGTKHGEVWSSSSSCGSRYNRWWNEEHYGDGRVRKWGNSTSGEHWDTVEHMDTYYNPVPHFGFQHAVGHSPQLWAVPLPSPDEADGGNGDDDGLGVGLGRL